MTSSDGNAHKNNFAIYSHNSHAFLSAHTLHDCGCISFFLYPHFLVKGSPSILCPCAVSHHTLSVSPLLSPIASHSQTRVLRSKSVPPMSFLPVVNVYVRPSPRKLSLSLRERERTGAVHTQTRVDNNHMYPPAHGYVLSVVHRRYLVWAVGFAKGSSCFDANMIPQIILLVVHTLYLHHRHSLPLFCPLSFRKGISGRVSACVV